MKVTYIGNPAEKTVDGDKGKSKTVRVDPPGDTATHWGIEFPTGKPVDVEDEGIIAKCLGSSHFEVSEGSKPAKPPKVSDNGNSD